ncbi:MAG: NAD(P)-binding protein, partial [Dehalococcoidia bacterium]|nr:NAD(P)-binding protein [Dehalococcoidia bacterium]
MDRTKFDIAVIGSGMGGLCAAALLAKAGLKVLVTERLRRIGGRCSTFEYQDFQCPTGALSPEVGATLESVYRESGAEFNVRPLQKVSFHIGGRTVQPKGEGLKGLLSSATTDTGEIDRLMTAYRRAMRWQNPSHTITMREWLQQYTDNPAVHGIFKSLIQSVLLINL